MNIRPLIYGKHPCAAPRGWGPPVPWIAGWRCRPYPLSDRHGERWGGDYATFYSRPDYLADAEASLREAVNLFVPVGYKGMVYDDAEDVMVDPAAYGAARGSKTRLADALMLEKRWGRRVHQIIREERPGVTVVSIDKRFGGNGPVTQCCYPFSDTPNHMAGVTFREHRERHIGFTRHMIPVVTAWHKGDPSLHHLGQRQLDCVASCAWAMASLGEVWVFGQSNNAGEAEATEVAYMRFRRWATEFVEPPA